MDVGSDAATGRLRADVAQADYRHAVLPATQVAAGLVSKYAASLAADRRSRHREPQLALPGLLCSTAGGTAAAAGAIAPMDVFIASRTWQLLTQWGRQQPLGGKKQRFAVQVGFAAFTEAQDGEFQAFIAAAAATAASGVATALLLAAARRAVAELTHRVRKEFLARLHDEAVASQPLPAVQEISDVQQRTSVFHLGCWAVSTLLRRQRSAPAHLQEPGVILALERLCESAESCQLEEAALTKALDRGGLVYIKSSVFSVFLGIEAHCRPFITNFKAITGRTFADMCAALDSSTMLRGAWLEALVAEGVVAEGVGPAALALLAGRTFQMVIVKWRNVRQKEFRVKAMNLLHDKKHADSLRAMLKVGSGLKSGKGVVKVSVVQMRRLGSAALAHQMLSMGVRLDNKGVFHNFSKVEQEGLAEAYGATPFNAARLKSAILQRDVAPAALAEFLACD